MIIIQHIQSLLIIIAAVMTIIAAVGLVSLKNDMKNVNYARIHIVGLFDIACIIGLIGLGYYLFAGIYIILAPFTAHAIGRANLLYDDNLNSPEEEVEEEVVDSPFIHPIKELKKAQKVEEPVDKDTFSISKIEISEVE